MICGQRDCSELLTWERQHCLLPEKAIRAIADLGLFGLTVAEEYGGQGGTQMDLVLMGLALGYHSQSVAITPGAAASLGIKPLQLCGSEDQKRAHLPDLAAGKRMFVFGLSEPGRGSDAANPEVRDAYRRRLAPAGRKMLVHECQVGQSYYSACDDQPRGTPRTSLDLLYRTHGRSACALPGDARQAGVDAVLHRRDCAGSGRSAGQRHPGYGTRRVSRHGDDPQRGRLFMAGLALASLAYALDRCCTYAQERRQFADQPIGRFQRVQDVILDMDIALEQGLTWLLHLVRQYDAGTLHREAAAKVKIECSRRASELLPLAMEIAVAWPVSMSSAWCGTGAISSSVGSEKAVILPSKHWRRGH